MKTITALNLSLSIALAAILLSACSKSEQNAPGHDHGQTPAGETSPNQDDIAYYTCPMHPSVRASNPKDTCPICKMDLTPVKKQKKIGNGADGEPGGAIVDIGLARLQQIGARTEPVVIEDLARQVSATAIVRYDESKLSDVNVRVSGWIQKLFVDRTGQWIEKGEPLFTLYSPELLAAQRDFLIAVRAAENLQDSSLRAGARERLRLWELGEEAIDAIEKKGQPQTNFTFTAARSGYVIEKMVLPGQRVEAGMTLYRVADLSTVWVEADFYESELPLLKEGDFVEVKFAGISQEFLGTIDHLYPFVGNETRTQRARIEVENPGGRIKPGMYARVTLDIEIGERLAVPVEAVMPTGQRHLVFVHRGEGRIEPRFVTLGVRADHYYEVVDGLKEGEEVLTRANFLIDSESRLQGAIQSFE